LIASVRLQTLRVNFVEYASKTASHYIDDMRKRKCILQGLKPIYFGAITPGLKPRPAKEMEFSCRTAASSANFAAILVYGFFSRLRISIAEFRVT
jgi:hypothetical protein